MLRTIGQILIAEDDLAPIGPDTGVDVLTPDDHANDRFVAANLKRNFIAHFAHGMLGMTGFRLIYAPTFVPTYVPISGAPLAVTPTPYAVPTSSFTGSENVPKGPPIWLTIALVCICIVILLIFGVLILGFVVRAQNQKSQKGGDHA